MPLTEPFSDEALLGRERGPLRPPAPGAPFDLVFLDRDGTLNQHRPGYVSRADDLRLLPGAVGAVRRLNEAGALIVLVTNQRGLATGELTEPQLLGVHRALVARLARGGAKLDAIHVCPHQRDACGCRKPLPGLLDQAFERAPWARPTHSLLCGDQPSDLAAAHARDVPAWQVGGREHPSLRALVCNLLGESDRA